MEAVEVDLLEPATLPSVGGGAIEDVSPRNDGVFGDVFVESQVALEIFSDQIFLEMVEPIGSGGGGGGTIPVTTDLLSGDGAGNAADSGIAPSSVVLKQTSFPTPNTENEIISCLQAAGLCA